MRSCSDHECSRCYSEDRCTSILAPEKGGIYKKYLEKSTFFNRRDSFLNTFSPFLSNFYISPFSFSLWLEFWSLLQQFSSSFWPWGCPETWVHYCRKSTSVPMVRHLWDSTWHSMEKIMQSQWFLRKGKWRNYLVIIIWNIAPTTLVNTVPSPLPSLSCCKC